VLLVREVLASLLVGEENRYVVVGKAGHLQLVGDHDCLRFALRNTKYCFLCHFVFLLLSFNFNLIVDVAAASNCARFACDRDLFFFSVDRAA